MYNAQISLYYDTDNTGYNGTLIASGISEDADSTNGSYVWNTSALPRGNAYYIYAKIENGNTPAQFAYSNGPILIKDLLTLIYPTNNSIIHNITPTFKWEIPEESSNKLLHFQLEISDDPAFNYIIHSFESKNDTLGFSPIPPVQQGKGNQFYTIFNKLQLNTPYFWRVKAWNHAQYYIESAIWQFKINK